MSARDLVNAIIAGEAINIENAFNSAISEKLSAGMDNMRDQVASNMFNEEVEQLDELSKTTLASYIKKANSSTADNAWRAAGQSLGLTKDEREKHQQTAAKTTMKRMAGVSKATDKLAKEETELNLEDFSLEELQDFMMSEDFEQLDEISKKTLGSYIKKASSQAIAAAEIGASATRRKRKAGIDKATDRLTKESVDQLDEWEGGVHKPGDASDDNSLNRRYGAPRQAHPRGVMSKSETVGHDGRVYHWRDPRSNKHFKVS